MLGAVRTSSSGPPEVVRLQAEGRHLRGDSRRAGPTAQSRRAHSMRARNPLPLDDERLHAPIRLWAMTLTLAAPPRALRAPPTPAASFRSQSAAKLQPSRSSGQRAGSSLQSACAELGLIFCSVYGSQASISRHGHRLGEFSSVALSLIAASTGPGSRRN